MGERFYFFVSKPAGLPERKVPAVPVFPVLLALPKLLIYTRDPVKVVFFLDITGPFRSFLSQSTCRMLDLAHSKSVLLDGLHLRQLMRQFQRSL